jgi:hypothetical protein
MTLEGLDLSGLQALAESAMITPCRVVRSGPGVFDPNTNLTTSTASLQWSGECNIETRQVQVAFTENAEGLVASTDYAIQIPVDAVVAAGDLLQVFDIDGNATVTRAFFIEGTHRPSWEVQQSLQVVEVPVTSITVT